MPEDKPFSVGVAFPTTDIEHDAVAFRDYAQAMEALGYSDIVAYDHVVGANPASRPGEYLPYNHESTFTEPMVLLSYLAGLTRDIGLMTGVVIMPQRQTVLFAKQAANLDIVTGGRLRLGLGVGYIRHEYDALSMDFATRGKRMDEQIPLLRRLWTEPLVTAKTESHFINDVGITPLPIQRPIPILIGGRADAALQRAARMGDGYLGVLTVAQGDAALDALGAALAAAKRDQAQVPVENIVILGKNANGPKRGVADAVADVEFWRSRGIAKAHMHTMWMDVKGVSAQIALMREIAQAIGLSKA